MSVYKRLRELDLTLPELPPRGGIYKPVQEIGGMLYVSGQGATKAGIPVIAGKLGAEVSIEDGKKAAQLCALNGLSVLHDYLGDLNRIRCLVKMLGFVASAAGFNKQPAVVDGASALLCDIFGEEYGLGSRSAIGVNELPGNIAVEIEFIYALDE